MKIADNIDQAFSKAKVCDNIYQLNKRTTLHVKKTRTLR